MIESLKDEMSMSFPMCATVEDKDPSIMWMSSVAGIVVRLLRQLQGADDRWSVQHLDEKGVIKFYQSVIDHSLPRIHRGHHSPMAAKNLPYMYPTFKRKCWTDCPPDRWDDAIDNQGSEVRKLCKKKGTAACAKLLASSTSHTVPRSVELGEASCVILMMCGRQPLLRTSPRPRGRSLKGFISLFLATGSAVFGAALPWAQSVSSPLTLAKRMKSWG